MANQSLVNLSIVNSSRTGLLRSVSVLLIGCAVFSASGCINLAPSRPEPSYAPTYPLVIPDESQTASSLFSEFRGMTLYSDDKARNVGDIITIELEEQTQASKSSETTLTKDTENELLEPILGTSRLRGIAENAGIANSISHTNEFTGEAEADQSNSLSGTITAVVAERLPNGLLRVQGEKWLNLSQGEEFVRVSGLVRQQDISATNTVSSLRLADSRIAYGATGEFADTNKPGWLARVLLSRYFPF